MSAVIRHLNSNESPDVLLGRTAASQHGVFSRRQAQEAGLSAGMIRHRTASRRWEPVLPSVFRSSGTPGSDGQAAMAATLWAGKGSLVSHGTAAVRWGIEGARSRNVEIWVPPGRAKVAEGVIVHRGTRLDRADRTVLEGIPITTPTRTLIDISGRFEDEALLAAMERAFRERLTTPERLAARITALRSSGRPGVGRLEALLDARPGAARALESRLEAKAWRILSGSSLPPCERQLWVVADGRRFRLDFAWSDRKVVVECDGWSHHGGRERFESDEARRASLASAGWLVVPVTWAQCARTPDAVVRRVGQALSSRFIASSARSYDA